MHLGKTALAILIALSISACENDTVAPDNSTASEQSSSAAVVSTEALQFSSQAGDISIPADIQRIAVLDSNALSTIKELGGESKVVAVPKGTSLPMSLQGYIKNQELVDTGNLKEPNLEKVLSVQPQLIIINNRMENMMEPLKQIAPTYFLQVDFKNYQNSFKEQTLNVAKMIGKTDEAEKQLAEIDQEIVNIKEKAKDKTALIVMVNNEKISAFGPESRFGHVYNMYGFLPADDSIKVAQHGMSVSPEYIAENNPDFLFVVDRGAAITEKKDGAKEVMNNDFVNKTKAAKNGKVIFLDSSSWYLTNMGLGGMKIMTKEIADALK